MEGKWIADREASDVVALGGALGEVCEGSPPVPDTGAWSGGSDSGDGSACEGLPPEQGERDCRDRGEADALNTAITAAHAIPGLLSEGGAKGKLQAGYGQASLPGKRSGHRGVSTSRSKTTRTSAWPELPVESSRPPRFAKLCGPAPRASAPVMCVRLHPRS